MLNASLGGELCFIMRKFVVVVDKSLNYMKVHQDIKMFKERTNLIFRCETCEFKIRMMQ